LKGGCGDQQQGERAWWLSKEDVRDKQVQARLPFISTSEYPADDGEISRAGARLQIPATTQDHSSHLTIHFQFYNSK
jgi:hypothetical protein